MVVAGADLRAGATLPIAQDGLARVWPRTLSVEVLAVALVLAVGWLAVAVHGPEHRALPTALAAATVLVVLRGLRLGRPVTTPHAGLAALACLIAVYTQAHGHATGVYLAVLVAAAVLVWPTGAPAEPHLLPVIWPLIDQTRGDPLAPFAMDRQKRYVFSADATAAVAYRVRAGFAVVSGDPVGDRRAYPDAIDAFARLCRDRGWRPLVLAASPRCAVLWRRRRVRGRPWWVVPIGHDAVVEVATFTLHGRGKRNLRQAVQRTHNARMTTTVLPEADITAALHDELLAVAHGSTKSIDAERGFSMMLDGTLSGRYPGTWLIVARDHTGGVQGFQRYATAGAGSEVSLDLPWRRSDAPNGTDERLTVDMIDWAKNHGGQRLSLSFAPLTDIFATDPDGPAQRLARTVLHAADGLIKLESLYRYVRKYDALGQKRYVLLTPVDLLPALVVLLTLEFGPHHSPLRRHRTRRMPGR